MATFARTGLSIASSIANAADIFTAGVVTRMFSSIATFARVGGSIVNAIIGAASSFVSGAITYGAAISLPIANLIRTLSGLTFRGAVLRVGIEVYKQSDAGKTRRANCWALAPVKR